MSFGITLGFGKSLFLTNSFSTSLNHFHQLAQNSLLKIYHQSYNISFLVGEEEFFGTWICIQMAIYILLQNNETIRNKIWLEHIDLCEKLKNYE